MRSCEGAIGRDSLVISGDRPVCLNRLSLYSSFRFLFGPLECGLCTSITHLGGEVSHHLSIESLFLENQHCFYFGQLTPTFKKCFEQVLFRISFDPQEHLVALFFPG